MLRRLAYPCWFVDLQDIFDRPELELCFWFNTGISFIDAHFKDRLLNPSQPWLTTAELLEYSAAVHAKGGLWLKAVENKWAKMCDSGCVHSLSLPFDVCYKLWCHILCSQKRGPPNHKLSIWNCLTETIRVPVQRTFPFLLYRQWKKWQRFIDVINLSSSYFCFLCVDNTVLLFTFCICQNISSFIHFVSGVMSLLI